MIVEVPENLEYTSTGVVKTIAKGKYMVLYTARKKPPSEGISFLVTPYPAGGKIFEVEPDHVNFVGYRGECAMCGKLRTVEKPDAETGS